MDASQHLVSKRTMAAILLGRASILEPALRRLAAPMRQNTSGYPLINNVIRNLTIGRTALYFHLPKERIRGLRG